MAPIYEYWCQKCETKFEVVLPRDEAIQFIKSPCCKGAEASKMISRCAFQLKGEGWSKDGYETSRDILKECE